MNRRTFLKLVAAGIAGLFGLGCSEQKRRGPSLVPWRRVRTNYTISHEREPGRYQYILVTSTPRGLDWNRWHNEGQARDAFRCSVSRLPGYRHRLFRTDRLHRQRNDYCVTLDLYSPPSYSPLYCYEGTRTARGWSGPCAERLLMGIE
jgi:hypothetical protein